MRLLLDFVTAAGSKQYPGACRDLSIPGQGGDVPIRPQVDHRGPQQDTLGITIAEDLKFADVPQTVEAQAQAIDAAADDRPADAGGIEETQVTGGDGLEVMGEIANIEEVALITGQRGEDLPFEGAVGSEGAVGMQDLVRQEVGVEVARPRLDGDGVTEEQDRIDAVIRSQVDAVVAEGLPASGGTFGQGIDAPGRRHVAIEHHRGISRQGDDLGHHVDAAAVRDQVEADIVTEGMDLDFSDLHTVGSSGCLESDDTNRSVLQIDGDRVCVVEGECLAASEAQRAGDEDIGHVDEPFSVGEGHLEELERRAVGMKPHAHLADGQYLLQVEFDPLILQRRIRIRRPCGLQVAIEQRRGSRGIRAGAAHRGVTGGIDVLAVEKRLQAAVFEFQRP